MVPFDREAGDGAQQIGFGAVIGKMLDRLADQKPGLLAGALLARPFVFTVRDLQSKRPAAWASIV